MNKGFWYYQKTREMYIETIIVQGIVSMTTTLTGMKIITSTQSFEIAIVGMIIAFAGLMSVLYIGIPITKKKKVKE